MWIVVGVVALVAIIAVVALAVRAKRAQHVPDAPLPDVAPIPAIHALHDALREVETLTDAKGSTLLDHVARDGRTIRDRLASSEAHLDSLRDPDDSGPLFERVLDEVAGANAAGDRPAPLRPED